MERLKLEDTLGCIEDDAERWFGEEEGEKGKEHAEEVGTSSTCLIDLRFQGGSRRA
jgi:hypothetical protein